MNLSPHFTLAEFTLSGEAARRGIVNDPPMELLPTLKRTALRAKEVRQIAPACTDLAARVVTLHDHKTKRTTGRPRHVPITRQAARLIGCCPQFTVGAGSLDALFRKARAQCGLAGFTFHDSRATALTLLSRKVDILTLQRISGHRNINQLVPYYRETSASIAARL